MQTKSKFNFLQKTLAWSVHIFTSSGIIAAFLSLLSVNEKDWRTAMFWLLICLIIDGVDGTFARLFKVKEVLPLMDGKSIDYVIDFVTYAFIPAYFFYSAELVGEAWKLPLTFLILLVSAIYYGKEGMIEDEQYFVGFPVLWNLAVFYLIFVFDFPNWGNASMVILLSVLCFVPIKTAYPSRSKRFKIGHIIVAAFAIISMSLTVYFYPERNLILAGVMIFVLFWFSFLAVYETYFSGQ